MKLLTFANDKIIKGKKDGILTAILHLAPAKLSGFNVCPMASKGCAAACLNTAGRGAYQRVQNARIRKTLDFFNDRDAFMAQLAKDIASVVKKAAKDGMIPAIRLNGTSDIRWETIPVNVPTTTSKGVTTIGGPFPSIMDAFPNVQFYDYTKLGNRRNLPANYHLTFSRSESNDADVDAMLGTNMNIAVVFSTKKGAALPKTWQGRKVIDGDTTDVRFNDPKGVIVGLRSKGRGRRDTSGFVVNV